MLGTKQCPAPRQRYLRLRVRFLARGRVRAQPRAEPFDAVRRESVVNPRGQFGTDSRRGVFRGFDHVRPFQTDAAGQLHAQRFVFEYRDDAIPRRRLNDFFHKAIE